MVNPNVSGDQRRIKQNALAVFAHTGFLYCLSKQERAGRPRIMLTVGMLSEMAVSLTARLVADRPGIQRCYQMVGKLKTSNFHKVELPLT